MGVERGNIGLRDKRYNDELFTHIINLLDKNKIYLNFFSLYFQNLFDTPKHIRDRRLDRRTLEEGIDQFLSEMKRRSKIFSITYNRGLEGEGSASRVYFSKVIGVQRPFFKILVSILQNPSIYFHKI